MNKKLDKRVYVFLAIFLGGIGLHKLYAGKYFMFFIYFCFSWTFIPLFVGIIEGLWAAATWE